MRPCRRRNIALIALLLGVALPLSGCGISDMYKQLSPWYRANQVQAITLLCSDTMNDDTPMAVDVLFVYNDILANQLLGQTASQWFAAKAQYRLKYGTDMDIVAMELVPNLSYVKVQLPAKARLAVKVILFANYMTPSGQYPVDLSTFQAPTVSLEQKEVLFSEK